MTDYQPQQELFGVVLAGGKSSRLGQDKASLSFQGRTLLDRTLDLASRFCRRTYCVGRRKEHTAADAGWMLDRIAGTGPMGGIITALETLKAPCLVLACDLPFLTREILALLISQRNRRPPGKCMTTFQHISTGYIQSLVAVYEPESLDLLHKSHSRGCYKLSRAIPFDCRFHIVYNPDQEKFFFNVNYPVDIQELS